MTDDDDLLAGVRTGEWLDRQVFPELEWAVEGIIPEGSSLLVGAPFAGKSLLALGACLAAASGGRALSAITVAQRPVLYLGLEDGDRRMQVRARAQLQGEPIPRGFEYLTVVTPPHRTLDTIEAWLDRHPGGLVWLDTLGKVMPAALPGESPYSRDYRLGSVLKRLADDHPGAAVVTNHHDRKAAASYWIDTVSGTNGLAGAADTVLKLSRPLGDESAGLLRVVGREVDEGEYRVVLGPAGWSLDGADLPEAARNAELTRITAGVGDAMGTIIEAVAELGAGAGVSPKEVGLRTGLDPARVRVYLSRAAETGRIRKVGRGRYASTSVTSVISPGLDDDE